MQQRKWAMHVLETGFDIVCKSCESKHEVNDGYNNQEFIEINVVGDYAVELKCFHCNNTIVVMGGVDLSC